MNNKNKSKKIISLGVMLFIVMLLVSGSTYAYWTWVTADDERTGVALNISAPGLAASMTGHTQNITNLIPVTSCTNEDYAVMKEINLFYENLSTNDAEIYGTLSVENFNAPNGTPSVEDLSHLHYAVTTSSDSCTSNPVRGMSGVFTTQDGELFTNQKLVGPIPTNTDEGSATYYLWVWLDGDYTYKNFGSGPPSDPMQNLSFTLKWSGEIRNDLTYVKGSPNAPSLDYGMVPVKIANNGTVTTVSSTDPTWYNYDNKEWANVVLVDADSRTRYLNNIGITVNQDDILAYYVWIPRYSYKYNNPITEITISEEDKQIIIDGMIMLAQSWGVNYSDEQATIDLENGLETGVFSSDSLGVQSQSTIQLIEEFNSVYGQNIEYSVSPQKFENVDIKFESKNDPVITGDPKITHITHPAFVFGTEKVSGLWVGKFAVTGDVNLKTILPNAVMYPNGIVSSGFIDALSFAGGTLLNGNVSFLGSDIYGLTSNSDSHMIKNSEWGAVIYLTHSIYGLNDEIRNNYSKISGCGILEQDTVFDDYECQIAYGGASSYPQSTTGNITGVFDFSTAPIRPTQVMGVLADDNGNPRSGGNNYNSGFNGMLYDGSLYTEGIDFPPAKYYDLYTSNDWMTACNGGICYGHALSELQFTWIDKLEQINSSLDIKNLSSDFPWLYRGFLAGCVNFDGNILNLNELYFLPEGSRGVDVDLFVFGRYMVIVD